MFLNTETLALIDIINQMELTEVCRTFLLNTKEYVFFLTPQGTFFSQNRAYTQSQHKPQQLQEN